MLRFLKRRCDMRKVKDWYVVVEWDDGTTEKLIGYDFAPDVHGYLNHFVKEVEQYRNEEREDGNAK
jgi:hypothetical protein